MGRRVVWFDGKWKGGFGLRVESRGMEWQLGTILILMDSWTGRSFGGIHWSPDRRFWSREGGKKRWRTITSSVAPVRHSLG